MARGTQNAEAEYIRVCGRVRPSKESKPSSNVVKVVSRNHLKLLNKDGDTLPFDFDAVFDTTASQEDVFAGVAERIIRGCLQGYNGTVFAYGQTGSGKTHTMLGPSTDGVLDRSQGGLIQMALGLLFELLEEKLSQMTSTAFNYHVGCSFVELYNENIFDLLDMSGDKLRLRHDRDDAVYIENATEVAASTALEAMQVVENGWKQRRIAETAMNRESSRSHAILILHVRSEQYENGVAKSRKACLNLVDLAGSERQSQSNAEGARLKEAASINKSLSNLARVIRALSEPQVYTHVPYRDSLLTHLLKDSLGGNARTAVVVNIHPDDKYYEQTKSTLQFSNSVRLIKNEVVANEDLKGDSVLAYQNEIHRLSDENARINAEHEKELEASQQETLQWKVEAQSLERHLAAARLQLRSLAVQRRKEGSVKEEEKGWEETKEEISRVVREAPATPATNIRSFHFRQMKEQLEQVLFEKDELATLSEGLREEKAQLQQKLAHFLEGALTPTKPRREALQPTETPAEMKKKRRQTRFAPRPGGRPSTLPTFFDMKEDGESSANLTAEEEKEDEGERKILQLEMANNSLQQMIDEQAESKKAVEALLKECQEKEAEWRERAETAEKQTLDSTAKLHEQLHKLTALEDDYRQVKRDLAEKADKCRLLCEQLAEQSVLVSEWKAEADRLTAELEGQEEQRRTEAERIQKDITKTLSQKEQQELEVRQQNAKLSEENAKMALDLREAAIKDEFMAEIIETQKKNVQEARQEASNAKEALMEREESLQDYIKTVEMMEQKEREKRAAEEAARNALKKDLEKAISEKEEMEGEKERLQAELHYEEERRKKAEDEGRAKLLAAEREWEKKSQQKEEHYQSELERFRVYVDNNSSDFTKKLNEMRAQFGVDMQEEAEKNGQLQDKINKLTIDNNLLRDAKENADKVVSETFGHANKLQKVHMVEKYRNENFSLRQENEKLRLENDSLKAAVAPRAPRNLRSTTRNNLQ